MTGQPYPVRYDAGQAAAYLGGIDPESGMPRFSARLVLDAWRRGDIVGRRIGGRILFAQSDLDRYLTGGGHERAGC